MNKLFLLIPLFIFLLIPNVLSVDTANENFFNPFDVNTESRVFLFIFISLGVAYVGLRFMPAFAGVIYVIASLSLFNTNVHLLYPLIYFIIAIMFIGRSLEPEEERTPYI